MWLCVECQPRCGCVWADGVAAMADLGSVVKGHVVLFSFDVSRDSTASSAVLEFLSA